MENPYSSTMEAITVAPMEEEAAVIVPRAGDCFGRLRHAGNIVFAVISFVLHVADVASSVAFVSVLFAHRDRHTNLNYTLWGSLVLGLHLLAGIVVNFVALLEKYNIQEMPCRLRPTEILICLIPWSRSWWAMWRHMGVAVRSEVSVSVVEWAAYTRLLQAVIEAAPQAIIQTFFLMKTFVYWVPLLSVCLSIANAAFSYTFFVVYKYYDNRREFPSVWKIGAIALNAILTSGGRAFATAMLAFSLRPWVAGAWVLFITALNLTRWKIKTWENDRLTRIKTISLLETLFVASTRQKTAYTTFIYIVFTFVFMQRYHVHVLAWTVWGVTFGALLMGFGLSLLTWGVYVTAYEELIFPTMASEK